MRGRPINFKCSEETRIKISEAHKGIKNGSFGIRGDKSPSWLGDKAKSRQKYYCIDCNDEISYDSYRCGSRRCGSCSKKGVLHPFYIDGRTSLRNTIRNLKEYSDWRDEIYKRDNYRCQECFQCGRRLEVHHIKEFSLIVEEFLSQYYQFSPIEDKETLVRLAITYIPFWNIENGKTLCKECHKSFK